MSKTMKAPVGKQHGSPLYICKGTGPEIGTGQVLIRARGERLPYVILSCKVMETNA